MVTMYQRGGPSVWDVLGAYRTERHITVPPASLSEVLPASHWEGKEPAVWPAQDSRAYWEHLYQLLTRAHAGIDADRIPFNYYRRTAQYYSQLLAAADITVRGREAPGWVEDAVTQATADWVVYGHSAGWVEDGMWRPLEPAMMWLGPDSTVWAYDMYDPVMEEDSRHFRLLTIDQTTHRVVQISHGRMDTPCDKILDLSAPQTADWPVLMVRRRPALDRLHGTSMFLDMEPIAAEIQHRIGLLSEVMDAHSRPILMLSQAPMTEPDYGQAGGKVVQTKKIGKEGKALVLDEAYSGAEYLSWDPQMQAVSRHLVRLEDALYATTSLPAALQSADRGIIATGVGLKKLYSNAYLAIKVLQRDLLRGLAALLDVQDQDIQWPHPFHELDEAQNLQGGPGMPEAAPDGGRPAWAQQEQS